MPGRIAEAPKVELHLHLEGAIPLDTLEALVDSHGGDPAVPDRGALVSKLGYRDFRHFIETWWWMTGFVCTSDDFTLVAESVARSLAEQNIIYAETSFSPADFARHGLAPQEIAVAIRNGLDRVPATQVVLNCDLVRDTGPEHAMRTLDAILEVAAQCDIRGITIGGSEGDFPPDRFVAVYRRAGAGGLRLTAHAGEAAGPASIRGALDLLGVERIGHGVRVVEEADLFDRVVAEQTPLEVCPTSNLRTGVVADWDRHPVGELLRRGANVTINTDDPTFFHTTLAGELSEIDTRFGSITDTRRLTLAAVDASWATETEKRRLRDTVDRWWSR